MAHSTRATAMSPTKEHAITSAGRVFRPPKLPAGIGGSLS